jgi:hypothetical protein
MHILTEDQYQLEMEPILKLIFNIDADLGYSDYDATILFDENIPARRIFYLEMVYLDDCLLNAVINAVCHLGGTTGCYITLLDRILKQPNHCYVPLEEMHEAFIGHKLERTLGMRFCSDYAIYSAQGNWGIVTTRGKYGLLGGSDEFIRQVEIACPALGSQVYNFLQHWKEEEIYAIEHAEHPEMLMRVETWIPDLLKHVYRENLAMQMLKEVGLCLDAS